MTLDDVLSLDRESRRWLSDLDREPFPVRAGRHLSWELGALVARGLAFRSHVAVSITDRGRAVLDRVS